MNWKSRSNNWIAFIIIITFLGIYGCDKQEIEIVSPPSHKYAPGLYPDSTITDGPFISVIGSNYTVRWIDKNRSVIEKSISGNEMGDFEADFGFPFEFIKTFHDRSESNDYIQEFSNVEKLVALSDIHGQYEIFVSLLKNNSVIDEDNNWIFGSGHLVICGDVFDRGNRVTEILWLIFKLENQANQMGGKLHYLLGNHEIMVLNKDLRYIDYKYETTARKMGTTYDQLYSKNTIIGEWLRTKPVIIKINDILFNHAGISPEFIDRRLTIQLANRMFQENIIDKSSAVYDADPITELLAHSNGPIWYRGYFQDDNFNENKLDEILEYFNAEHIIVGHTTMDDIVYYFNNKVIAIDSGIKYGDQGNVLLYNNGVFSIGTID